MSSMGVVWVRLTFCWLLVLTSFFAGVGAGLAWIFSLAG